MGFQLSTLPEPLGLVQVPNQVQIKVTPKFATLDPVEEFILIDIPDWASSLNVQKLLNLEIQTRYDLY